MQNIEEIWQPLKHFPRTFHQVTTPFFWNKQLGIYFSIGYNGKYGIK